MGIFQQQSEQSAMEVRSFLWENKVKKLPLRISKTNKIKAPEKVPEDVYWEEYYELSDIHYEWNDGFLEEKPVSDYKAIAMFLWFMELLGHFIKVYPIGKIMTMEMGFRMKTAQKTVIRKPDAGVILNTNPVDLNETDIRYSGIVDLCVELLSDSNKKNIERDTKIKKEEYCLGGVEEYFILDGKGKRTVFYHRLQSGKYAKIEPVDGIVKSKILPGFQLRIDDLYSRPSLEEMSGNKVYRDFVMPFYQAEKEKVKIEFKRAEQEKQRAEQAEQRA
ncbi:MAG: Uma2 family endonuclease, partial [Thermodesulfobacteriota bacterium]|nr:Uma2 family endonuclease [Thermodesulfobacteriota bacterium]